MNPNPTEKSIVVQSNQMLENRPAFTKDETRLFLTIVASIDKSDTEFGTLRLPVSQFAELWGLDSNNLYARLKAALVGLRSKSFVFEDVNPDTGKKRFLTMGTLTTAAYEDGEGYALVKITPDFKPYLLSLQSRFTSYVLKNIMSLSSVNAIRNYELLKQYENLKARQFTISEYKKLLHIEDKYPVNADLKRYVIEPAINEINQFTDIFVRYEWLGRGKRSSINFLIEKKKNISEIEGTEIKETPAPATDDLDQVLFDDFQIRADRNKICSGFDDEIFDEFTDDQLTELRSVAWEMVDHEDVMHEQAVLGDPLVAKEFVVARYIRSKILMCNARGKKVKHRYGYIKRAVAEDYE